MLLRCSFKDTYLPDTVQTTAVATWQSQQCAYANIQPQNDHNVLSPTASTIESRLLSLQTK